MMLNREEIESIFDKIDVKLREKGTPLTTEIPGLIQTLKKVKQKILDEHAIKTPAAGEFTTEMAILTFGLQFSEYGTEYLWRIEDLPDTRESPTLPLDAILEKYAQTVDRSSKTACRTPIDLILIECVAKLQAKLKSPASCDKMRSLAPHKSVRVCCDVPFSYHLSPKPVGEAAAAIDSATTVNGRVDHGVGVVALGPNRRFQSLLIVEAETKENRNAFPKLVVYLACLRQARMASGCTDCTVYGFTSDGYNFCFVTITHGGVVKVSRSFSISRGEMKIVIGCIMHILRQAVERSQTVTPNRTKVEGNAGGTHDHDEAMNIDLQDGHDCDADE